jgi:hypothetical protein
LEDAPGAAGGPLLDFDGQTSLSAWLAGHDPQTLPPAAPTP